MSEIRCWEYKKCGRQPEGANAAALGVCPAALSQEYCCWNIAGTMSSGKVEGFFAKKIDTCIICDYYNKMQSYSTKTGKTRFYLFGQHLCNKGLITNDHVIQARSLQLRQNQKIGVIAKNKGLLTEEQVHKILTIQEETLQKFGEIAVELGLLTVRQVRELIQEQDDNYLFFGEALVQLGAITEEEMFVQLKEYNTKKLEKMREQEKNRKQINETGR